MKRNVKLFLATGTIVFFSTVVLSKAVFANSVDDVSEKIATTSSQISSVEDNHQESNVSSSATTSSLSTENSVASNKQESTEQDILKNDQKIGPGFYDNQVSTISTSRSRIARSTSSVVSANAQDIFLNQIKSGAIDSWKKYKVLPSVTAAQAILESGWGKSTLAKEANNLFGIKGRYNNQYVLMPTQEFVNGHYITIQAEFRKYPTQSESMIDHGVFLTSNSRYNNLIGQKDYKTFARLLQQDGYATAPTYAESLIRIVEQYHLQSWDQEAMLPSNAGYLDQLNFNGNALRVQGWSVTSNPENKPYSYLFAMDTATGRELKRWSVNRINRPDVQNIMSGFPNSLNSGFDSTIQIGESFAGKKIKIMARYSSGANGDGSNQDYVFDNSLNIPTKKTTGYIDNLKQQGQTLWIQGWQVGTYIQNRPYRYLFVMDKATNRQITSLKISSVSRPDVGKVNSEYPNATQSGFNVKIPVTHAMKNKNVYVIARYTSDINGNQNGLDFSANQIITKIK